MVLVPVITDSFALFKTFENHGEFQSFQRFAPFQRFEGGGPPNLQDRLGGPSLLVKASLLHTIAAVPNAAGATEGWTCSASSLATK